jgi:hypothetical protein
VSVFPSRLVQVGLVKERGFGAGGAPAMQVPVTAAAPNDLPTVLRDNSWRKAPVDGYGHVISGLQSQLRLGGPVLCDSIGFLLSGVLGDVAFTAGAPNSWTFALKNNGDQQPASFAATVADPVAQLGFAGCKVGQVILSFDPDKLLTWEAMLFGLASSATGYAMPAASAEHPLPGWRGVATLGGTVTAEVLTGQVQLARPVVAKQNVNGSLSPWLQRSDVLSVVGQMTMIASSDALRQQWQAGTETSLDLLFSNGASGAAARSLRLHCSNVVLNGADRSYGQRWVELAASFIAEPNTADVGGSGGYSPIKATLQNAVASGTY